MFRLRDAFTVQYMYSKIVKRNGDAYAGTPVV